MKATNQTVQRSFNRSLVLFKVRQETRISRVDLSRALGLEKSSISAIVSDLVDQGLLLPTVEGESSVAGGRKPVFLELNANFCAFLGIELQPTRFQAVVIDLNGRIMLRDSGEIATWRDGFEATLETVFKRLEKSVRELPIPLAAVSIGIPGLVNPFTGMVTMSVPHGLQDWNLSACPNPWGVPAFIENDANCCAWAQLLGESSPVGGNFLALLMEFQDSNPRNRQEAGVSLGVGAVINGEVHYGSDYTVGEFRSLFWRRGNLSQTGIPDHRLSSIATDPAVQDEFLQEILLNLTPVVSILAPDRLILCGEAHHLMGRIQHLIDGPLSDSWVADADVRSRICRSQWEQEVVAVGAAGRIIVSLFNSRSLSKSAMVPGLDWSYILERFARPR